MAATLAERQRRWRKRQTSAELFTHQSVYTHPGDKKAVSELVAKLRDKRLKEAGIT